MVHYPKRMISFKDFVVFPFLWDSYEVDSVSVLIPVQRAGLLNPHCARFFRVCPLVMPAALHVV